MPGSKKVRIDTAVRNLDRAAEPDPDHFESFFMLSEIYRITGDPDKTEKYRRLGEEAEARVKNNIP